jgi:uncharacterized SAM-binding protein YcdF (DUF218 family)
MTYIQPVLPGIVILLFLAIVVMKRHQRLGRRVLVLAACVLFLWSWSPTVQLTSRTLESWYSVTEHPSEEAQAIVVLAGGSEPVAPSQPEPLLQDGSYRRTLYAAWLYRTWMPLPVLVSGGKLREADDEVAVSELMKDLLVARGVPFESVQMESQSHSTYENALYSAQILKQRGLSKVVLVTEGYHMLRAERCFRRQGIQVVPAPCSLRSLQDPNEWSEFVPSISAMQRNEECLHEWAGLAWYWMTGKI